MLLKNIEVRNSPNKLSNNISLFKPRTHQTIDKKFIRQYSSTPAPLIYTTKMIYRENKAHLYLMEFSKITVLSEEIIDEVIDRFFEEVMSKLDDNEYVLILFKTHYINKDKEIYATFGSVQLVTKNDQEEYNKYIRTVFFLKSENYKTYPLKRIILEFFIKVNTTGNTVIALSTLRKIKKSNTPNRDLKLTTKILFSTNLPSNRNYLK